MWTERKKILLLIVFHIHFVTIQIMLTWTLIGRSHIGFHQMLKKIERVSWGRWGPSAQGETHTGNDWMQWQRWPRRLLGCLCHHKMIQQNKTSTAAPPGRGSCSLISLHTNTHTSRSPTLKAQCTLNLILHKLQQSRQFSNRVSHWRSS